MTELWNDGEVEQLNEAISECRISERLDAERHIRKRKESRSSEVGRPGTLRRTRSSRFPVQLPQKQN